MKLTKYQQQQLGDIDKAFKECMAKHPDIDAKQLFRYGFLSGASYAYSDAAKSLAETK